MDFLYFLLYVLKISKAYPIFYGKSQKYPLAVQVEFEDGIMARYTIDRG